MAKKINMSHLEPRHIPISEFASYVSDMLKEYKLGDQYEHLWQVGVDQPMSASMLRENWHKNRYINVLAYDHSRVKLSAIAGEPGSDYINANYIPGYKQKHKYIAAQGPLDYTIVDFWRMVWEQDVYTVVMLIKDVGRKCSHYWKEGEPLHCGSISITLQSEEKDKNWAIKEFLLVKDKTERLVRHYQFTAGWPDYDVPDSTGPVIELVKYFRSKQDTSQSDHGPVVVHCGGGVGRTGTFIALDILLQHIKDHDWVDVFGLACEMRRYRDRMIETEDQYVFIHKALIDVIRANQAR